MQFALACGTIGGGGRLDFTVIVTPSTPPRGVESATRQTDDDILITDATRRAMTGATDRSEDRPPMTWKGKSEPVRLYAPIRAMA